MKFQKFWEHLKDGGRTPHGWTYHLLADGRLHINSPNAKNKEYYITMKTVKSYFWKLQKGMDPEKFSYHHSAWFRGVYEHIVK